MIPRPITVTLKVLAGIICGALAVWSAGISAGIGAGVGGLREGGWNWQFLPSIYLGWLAGFLITLVLAVIIFTRSIRWYLQLPAILLAAPVTTFVVSSLFYFFALMPDRIEEARNSKFLTEARNDTTVVDRLLQQARSGKLTPIQRSAIGQSLGRKNRFGHSETVFLLDYFQKDISAVAAIMRYQPVTESDLRMIFSRYDNTESAFTRIYDELIEHPLTPIDILDAIAQNGRCPEHMTKKAIEARTKKSNKAVDSTATRGATPAPSEARKQEA